MGMIEEMFSERSITPGTTRTSDLVWWWRQRVNDLGLGTWFQPSVEVQRKGATDAQLGADPVIQRGDVLHCDVGITALRLNTDTQHMAYVLRDGETRCARRAAAGARQRQHACRTSSLEEIQPGPHRQRRSSRRRARRMKHAAGSTARCTRIPSACTATAPGR